MIRYFAVTDESEIGALAFEYLRGLLRCAPVRVISLSMGCHGHRWEAAESLLITPLAPVYVNVVCAQPSQWVTTVRVSMPNLDAHGRVVSTEPAQRQAELYTQGVRNVLLVGTPPPAGDLLEGALATALRYQAFVVPSRELADLWRPLDCHPVVLPVPVLDVATLRAVITPSLQGRP